MGGFCKHCGKELEGDEPYCPECGMPTGSVQPVPVQAPKKNDMKIAVAVICMVTVLCIVGIALLPSLINTDTGEKYTVTMTVKSYRIDVEDIAHQYNGPGTVGEVSLSIICTYGSSAVNKELQLNNNYLVNSGNGAIHEGKFAVDVTGDPNDVKFTIFMNYTVVDPDSGMSITDIIDIYKVEPAPTGVKYVGTSGIAFTVDEIDKDGNITLNGDSDPIGTIELNIVSVKK